MASLLPSGCGGSQDDYVVVSQPRATSTAVATDVESKVLIQRLEDCAKRGGVAHNESSYAIQFDVEATPDGKVTSVKLRDSTLGDQALENCMIHGFDDLVLPPAAIGVRFSEPFSGGEQSRNVIDRDKLGVVQAAAGGVIAIGPFVIAVGAVYILTQVTVQVVVPAVQTAIRRKKRESACQKLWESCINFAPTQCLKQSAGKSFCTLCWERCNAAELASPECQICGF